MSAADFLFAPEVQKLLALLYATPRDEPWTTDELAKRARLDAADAARTLAHLVASGILKQEKTKPPAKAKPEDRADGDLGEVETAEPPGAVSLDRTFVFHDELRSIALKSFAAAEPLRAMLRSKFKASVVRAFLLGEDADGTLELLVVHGQSVPEEAAMAAACQKLSKALHRHLKVHVISHARFSGLTPRDALGAKLAAGRALEIVAPGDTKAALPAERVGLLRKLATLSRGSPRR